MTKGEGGTWSELYMQHMPETGGDMGVIVPPTAFEKDLERVLNGLSEMLREKNRKYGDSALNPSRVFAKSDAIEQIRVRIDDKLSRIKNIQDDDTEDAIQDLIGYLIILRIAMNRKEADGG